MRLAFTAALLLVTFIQTVQAQTTPRKETDRWFGGNLCLNDCTRHRAGYRWALETGVNSYEDCPQFEEKSFLIGCRVYVDDPHRDPDFDDDDRLIRKR